MQIELKVTRSSMPSQSADTLIKFLWVELKGGVSARCEVNMPVCHKLSHSRCDRRVPAV
jgi:hypothetical protein